MWKFLLFLPLAAQAQIANVRVETTPTQAVIHYVAPDTSSCAVLVYDMNRSMRVVDMTYADSSVTVTTALTNILKDSDDIYLEGTGVAEWDGHQNVLSVVNNTSFVFSTGDTGSATAGNIGVLVHDTNNSLFTGAHLDSRYGGNASTRDRVFIVGQRRSEIGNDGASYSRALQAFSRHRYVISCGSDTATGEFTTKNIPLGALAVDIPKPASPGLSAWPSIDKSARWEKAGGVFLDNIIDPVTGVLYTSMYPPEIATDTAFALSTTNTPTPVGTNWTNPGNVRTQDATNATYAAATQDPLIVRPYKVFISTDSVNELGNNKAAWLAANTSLESVKVTVRGAGATGATAENRQIEIALSVDGGVTAATNWQTLTLPETTLGDVSFPSGTPKGGFGDWHSATQRRLNHIDVVTRRMFVDGSGTTIDLRPQSNSAWLSNFEPDVWVSGSKIRIGGTTNDACSAGTEYDIASVQSPRQLTLQSDAGTISNQWACAANFAVMLRKKTTSTDAIAIDYVTFALRTAHIPASTASGSAKSFAEKPVTDADGNEGYLSYVVGMGGGAWTIHWVSKDNGESRFIMGHLVNFPAVAGTDGWGQHSCAATENTFSATDPTAFYCAPTGNNGGQIIVKYKIHWDGSDRWKSQTPSITPFSACTTTSPASPNPCLEATNLLAGYTLAELMEDRNPDFDSSKYAVCSIRGIQSHLAILQCQRSVQDTVSWYGAFDLDKPIASYDPMDQSTNPIVGLISTMHPSLRGIAVLHSALTVPGTNKYLQFSPKFGRRTNNATDSNGAGPWAMRIVGNAALNNTTDISACPANQWNHADCSTIHVTSQPFDPDPGAGEAGTPGEYRDMIVGDGVYFWKCDSSHVNYTHETYQEGGNKGCDTYAQVEYGRILAISGTAPDITLTVARGIVSGYTAESHASGWSLYSYPITDYNVAAANVNIIWDIETSPIGTPESGVSYVSVATSHMSTTGKATVGYVGSGGYSDIAWTDSTKASLTAAPHVNLNLPSTVWPTFAGKIGMRYGNTIQQYKANNHTDYDSARDNAYRFFIDSRPWMATPGSNYRTTWEKVGGATYIYRYKQQQDLSTVLPYFKHAPYWVAVGNRTLIEKSGPSITLSDNSSDHWKYCLVYRPGECWSGSIVGEIYLNAKYANLTNLADYTCYGGYHWQEADICGTTFDAVAGPSMQFYYGNSPTMGRGRHLRKLGWGLVEFPHIYGQVPKVYPTGNWLGPLTTNFVNYHRQTTLLMKLPPIPAEDGYDRTTFVPITVAVGSVPAGTSIAQVEFGYHDFGTPAQLYCTARQESCLATGTKIIGDGVATSQFSTTNTAATYAYQNVTVTAATPMRLTFPSAHKFTSDVRVKATISTSGNNNKFWPITIINSTTVDLTGSVSGDVSTGSQWVMAPTSEAPFAFSGESFSVASASNANPIEIGTTTMHRFQTGSRVCISGVGGNTAANGCHTITATGPSVFTLDGVSGNGSYTSGGTVTPGGVACASGCTVAIPAVTSRVLYYRWRYLDASGALLTTGNTQTTAVP